MQIKMKILCKICVLFLVNSFFSISIMDVKFNGERLLVWMFG